MMEYKGYVGKVDFDDAGNIFHGEVINSRDVITFQGSSVSDLKQAFRDSIDDYLEFCKQRNEEPDKPYSGQFVTRIPPELHRQVSLLASLEGVSLNAWIQERLWKAVGGRDSVAAPISHGGQRRAKKTDKKMRVKPLSSSRSRRAER